MASPYTQDQVSAYVGELQKLVDSGQITQDVANRTIANELRYLPSIDAATSTTGQIAEAYPGLSQEDVMNVYNQIVAPEVLAGVAGVSGNLRETSPEIFDIFAENYAAALDPGTELPTLPVDSSPPADTSGILGVDSITPPADPGVDLSGLTGDQQAFAQTLPANLQDDYIASIGAGLGDETSGATVASLAELLKGRGLSFDEAAQATGLTADNPNYQEAVRAYYGLASTSTDLTPGGMQQFSYTDFPGGIYGPGQQMPNIFVPANQQQPAAPPAAPGPRTMVSPGITTYAYPQPFGEIDIFGRPTATPPTAYTPPADPTTTTT